MNLQHRYSVREFTVRYRLESLLQLSLFSLLGYFSADLFNQAKDLLLFITAWLLVFVVIAGGWPYAPPLGTVSRRIWKTGLLMSSLLPAAAVTTYLSLSLIRMFPPEYVGGSMIYVAGLWGVVLESWPMRHYHPRKAFAAGALLSFPAAVVLSTLLQNRVAFESLFGFYLTHMALSFMFSPSLVFQGHPFHRLWRQPSIGFAAIFSTLPVAFAVFYLLGHLSSQSRQTMVAFFSSMILWQVLHSWAFCYLFSLKRTQPLRGLITSASTILTAAAWTYAWTNLTTPLNVAMVNLLIILPSLIIHNIFWLRKPFSAPLLFGSPAQGQTSLEKLNEWFLQVAD